MIGAFLDDWLSGWRGRVLLAVVLVVLIAFPWMAGEDGRFYTLLLMTVFIFATLGHAWNLLAGYCGLLSFGLQVYVGLGGFTVGILNFYGGAHVWLALPVAGVAAALFAWLLAVPVSDRRWSCGPCTSCSSGPIRCGTCSGATTTAGSASCC